MSVESGVIVSIDDEIQPFDVNTAGAKTDVRETFSYAQTETATLRAELRSLQNELLGLMKSFDQKEVDIDFDKINYDKVQFPSWKKFAEVVLNDSWPTDTPIKPTLDDIDGIDWTIIEPPEPEILETYFSFTPGVYSSEIRAALISSVLNDLEKGGVGISESAYNAIINKEKRARLRNQSEALRDAMQALDDSGIAVTSRNGQAGAIISSVFRAQVHADEEALENIVKLDYEYTVRAKEFSQNLALEIEKLLSGDFNESETRRFEAGKAEYELLMSAVDQNIALYKEKWAAIVSKTQYVVALIDGKTSINKNKTDMYIAEWDGIKSATEAIASENSAKLQQRGLEISNNQAEFSSIAIQRQENRADAEIELRQELAELDTQLRVAGINLDGYKAEADLKTGVLSGLVKVVAQVVASTIGVMNASASMSFSGSDSKSKSVSQSKSLSEAYSGEV